VPTSLPRARLTIQITLASDAAPKHALVLEPALEIGDARRDALRAIAAPSVRGPLLFEVAWQLGNDA
jgi:hypothetical protein